MGVHRAASGCVHPFRSPGEAARLRDGVPHGEHQPGGGVQDEPHPVGGGVPATGAVGNELAFVQLD